MFVFCWKGRAIILDRKLDMLNIHITYFIAKETGSTISQKCKLVDGKDVAVIVKWESGMRLYKHKLPCVNENCF